jgi:hypothetical protein
MDLFGSRRRITSAHHVGAPLRAMTRFSQFVALATGHLAKGHSLRDIVSNPQAQASRLPQIFVGGYENVEAT